MDKQMAKPSDITPVSAQTLEALLRIVRRVSDNQRIIDWDGAVHLQMVDENRGQLVQLSHADVRDDLLRQLDEKTAAGFVASLYLILEQQEERLASLAKQTPPSQQNIQIAVSDRSNAVFNIANNAWSRLW